MKAPFESSSTWIDKASVTEKGTEGSETVRDPKSGRMVVVGTNKRDNNAIMMMGHVQSLSSS